MSDPVAAFLADALREDGEVRRIFLRNLTLQASIGIHPKELAARQRLFINVELFLKPQGDAGDDIGQVLDYDKVRRGIVKLVEARHYNLQETLVEEIVTLCFAQQGVLALRVSTEKPDVYPDCQGVGYEVFRVAR
jgi:dihydroneopterin aldolase